MVAKKPMGLPRRSIPTTHRACGKGASPAAATATGRKKRLQGQPESLPAMHPRNRYAENPPDFAHLASLYPTFEPFVFYGPGGSPRIDWTDFNATRELTRILLHHDYHLSWWIPDGQLCPTVPNRLNYIHWVHDLLSSTIIPPPIDDGMGDRVRGLDIGSGANCIYPLLGASLFGWSFVATDTTEVALEWAKWNAESNPHVSDLIEVRKADGGGDMMLRVGDGFSDVKDTVDSEKAEGRNSLDENVVDNYHGPPILVGVVHSDEKFDFCMCNPPFFGSISEAGLNPKTSCGGTYEEMVCPGGERAFITRIIEDSVLLKCSFRWFTSMVGKKANLKYLGAKLREVGACIVKTTEFFQGKTCRWGIAWTFLEPAKKMLTSRMSEKSVQSFMLKVKCHGLQLLSLSMLPLDFWAFSDLNKKLKGLHCRGVASQILKFIEEFFVAVGAHCKTNTVSFGIDIIASYEVCHAIARDATRDVLNSSMPSELRFQITVFEQAPGTCLVRGSLQSKQNPYAGLATLVL